MTEKEIREILSKIKTINKKFVSYYFAKNLHYDDDLPENINESYISSIRSIIGSINNVKSSRILKALGFEPIGDGKYTIPINCFDLIDEGTTIYHLLGDEFIIGQDDINLDTRNGLMCYYINFDHIKR